MSRFFTEQGENLSKSERTEFLDLLMEKMMKESEQQQELVDTDIEILKLGSEMKSDLEHLKSTTANDIPTETQTKIEKHGTELDPHGQSQDDLRTPEALVKDSLDQEEIARIEIETPLHSADQATSEITSQLESQGYEKIASEIQEIGRIEHEFKTLETELDSNPLAQPEVARPLDPEIRVDLSTAPEIVQPLNPELQSKTLNAESKSELGSGELA